MSHSKIPFGLSVDQKMVDVRSVQRGQKCACTCPSCRTPLIARQGTEKAWHFAHLTRGTHALTAQQCEFAFFVSVRLMARQMLAPQFEVVLPDCVGTLDPGLVNAYRFSVTQSRRVVMQNVRVEERIAGTVVDAIGEVEGFPLVLYVEHPGRTIPEALHPSNLRGQRVGAVAIDLNRITPSVLFASDDYKAALARFLSWDLPSKAWIYHPRYEQAKARAIATRPSCNLTKPVVDYSCLMCRIQWQAPANTLATCPDCGEHLYTREKKPPP